MTVFMDVSAEPYRVEQVDSEIRYIPTVSAFFRSYTGLTSAVDEALANYDAVDGDGFSVLSVGVSFGAEADSVLAYTEAVAPHLGAITLTGIDSNPAIIERARDSKYWLPSYSEEDEHELRTRLPPQMGDLSWERIESEHPSLNYGWVMDTNNLRQRHNVSFLVGDLISDSLPVSESNLILCNNVLYHLGRQRADDLVDAMVGKLKAGGTLSLEVAADRVSSVNDEEGYPAWRQKLSERLQKAGFLPFLGRRSNIASLFQKLD